MHPVTLFLYILLTLAVVSLMVTLAGGLTGAVALVVIAVAGRLWVMWSRRTGRSH